MGHIPRKPKRPCTATDFTDESYALPMPFEKLVRVAEDRNITCEAAIRSRRTSIFTTLSPLGSGADASETEIFSKVFHKKPSVLLLSNEDPEVTVSSTFSEISSTKPSAVTTTGFRSGVSGMTTASKEASSARRDWFGRDGRANIPPKAKQATSKFCAKNLKKFPKSIGLCLNFSQIQEK
ncbi:MAG: hypothetical protein O9301_11920 [Leptospira sp.]|nr:hypothetical protein [Leptospira sp.]